MALFTAFKNNIEFINAHFMYYESYNQQFGKIDRKHKYQWYTFSEKCKYYTPYDWCYYSFLNVSINTFIYYTITKIPNITNPIQKRVVCGMIIYVGVSDLLLGCKKKLNNF